MLKKILTSTAFLLLALQAINAQGIWRLQCSSDTNASDCKTEFGNLFLRSLHFEMLKFAEHILNTIVEEIETQIDEIGSEDYEGSQVLQTALNEAKELQEEIRNSRSNHDAAVEKFGKAGDMIKALSQRSKYISEIDLFEKTTTYVSTMFPQVMENWSQLYAGLRDIDFKEYPEYNDLNESVEEFKKLDAKNAATQFEATVKNVSNFFGLEEPLLYF